MDQRKADQLPQTPVAKACSSFLLTPELAREGIFASAEQVFLQTLYSSQVIVRSR